MRGVRPCLDCGTPVSNANRCPQHKLPEKPKPPRPHYTGNYRARSAAIRATATVCWLCGDGPRNNDPWTADHLTPGDPNSDLAPAHRSCNSRRGRGQATRRQPRNTGT